MIDWKYGKEAGFSHLQSQLSKNGGNFLESLVFDLLWNVIFEPFVGSCILRGKTESETRKIVSSEYMKWDDPTGKIQKKSSYLPHAVGKCVQESVLDFSQQLDCVLMVRLL